MVLSDDKVEQVQQVQIKTSSRGGEGYTIGRLNIPQPQPKALPHNLGAGLSSVESFSNNLSPPPPLSLGTFQNSKRLTGRHSRVLRRILIFSLECHILKQNEILWPRSRLHHFNQDISLPPKFIKPLAQTKRYVALEHHSNWGMSVALIIRGNRYLRRTGHGRKRERVSHVLAICLASILPP
jgi:hypothetical protein